MSQFTTRTAGRMRGQTVPAKYVTIKIREQDHRKLTEAMVQEAARRKRRLSLVEYTGEVIEAGLRAKVTGK